jgi:hypothetical protein
MVVVVVVVIVVVICSENQSCISGSIHAQIDGKYMWFYQLSGFLTRILEWKSSWCGESAMDTESRCTLYLFILEKSVNIRILTRVEDVYRNVKYIHIKLTSKVINERWQWNDFTVTLRRACHPVCHGLCNALQLTVTRSIESQPRFCTDLSDLPCQNQSRT